jgi:hypothetical protein
MNWRRTLLFCTLGLGLPRERLLCSLGFGLPRVRLWMLGFGPLHRLHHELAQRVCFQSVLTLRAACPRLLHELAPHAYVLYSWIWPTSRTLVV